MNDKIQELLEAAGIKDFDELRDFEKPIYFKWLEIAQTGQITIEDIKRGIKKMREGIEYSLAIEDLSKSKDIFLKARLKNYILIEAILERPERAKDILDSYGKMIRNKV